MSPADELRAAAKALRETAATTSGYPTPWHIEAKFGAEWLVATPEPHLVASGDKPIADWIALASPALAEPLAAWLEVCANDLADARHYVDEPVSAEHALRVARAINGGAR